MTDINIDNSFNDSFSISCLSSKERFDKITIKDDECQKDYPIRCAICWRIPRFYAEFEKNIFYTLCDNNHKLDYTSFESFYENSNKKLDSLLCEGCHKPLNDNNEAFQCNTCYIFFCSDCKLKHKEEMNHLNYIEKEKIDIYCPQHNENYKYYDSKKKSNLCEKCYIESDNKSVFETAQHINYKETIDAYVKKIKENIMICKNVSKLVNEWLTNLEDKFTIFIDSINNYVSFQQKIVTYLSHENKFLNYQNNFNVYFNYEIINNEKIDKYIKTINTNLNNNYNKNINHSYKRKSLVVPSKDGNIKKRTFKGKYRLTTYIPVKYNTVPYFMLIENVRINNDNAMKLLKRGKARDVLNMILDSLDFLSYVHK